MKKKTKVLTVTDKDGIESAKVIKNSQYFKEAGKLSKDGKTMVFKMTRDTNGKSTLIIVRVKDKYKRTEKTDDIWIPKTKKSSNPAVVDDKDVNYWNSTGNTKSTTSGTKSSSSSSTKTTSSTKSSNSKPTISWNGKILKVHDDDGIRDVKISTSGLYRYKKENTTWYYKPNENTAISSDLRANVQDKKTKKWEYTKYVTVKVSNNYATSLVLRKGKILYIEDKNKITRVKIKAGNYTYYDKKVNNLTVWTVNYAKLPNYTKYKVIVTDALGNTSSHTYTRKTNGYWKY